MLRIIKIGLPILLAAVTLPAIAQDAKTPLSAEAVVAQARKEAGNKKRSLVIFHASWCGWCHKLDKSLDDPAIKKVMDKYYVITHLVVLESEDKKSLENEGGDKFLKEWGGDKGGIPFFVALDSTGKKLGDSNRMPKNGNIGYPAEPAEIDQFIGFVKETAKGITGAELETLKHRFTKLAPKPAGQGR